MKEFQEKFAKLLAEHKISEDSAKAISEAMIEGLKAQEKVLAEAKAKEEASIEELVKTKLEALKKDQDESVTLVSENVKKLKRRHKFQLESIQKNVKKLIKEDYEAHKKELTQKVKLFVESKISKVEEAVKAKTIAEAKVEESKLSKIAEAITPFFKDAPKADPAVAKLSEEVTRLKKKINLSIAENLKLKSEKEVIEKTLKEQKAKPMAEIAKTSKIGKVLENKEIAKEAAEKARLDENLINGWDKSLVFDMWRLSGKTAPKVEASK